MWIRLEYKDYDFRTNLIVNIHLLKHLDNEILNWH